MPTIESEVNYFKNNDEPNQIMSSISLQDAARFLGISNETTRNLAVKGKIPGVKIGGRWRFITIDLIFHIRSQYSKTHNQTKTRSPEQWHSSNVAKRGGFASATMANEYREALGLRTK